MTSSSFAPQNGHAPLPREVQQQNLQAVKDRKHRKLEKLLNSARKQGQIRALERMSFLLGEEINKEIRELVLIEQELEKIKWEPRN